METPQIEIRHAGEKGRGLFSLTNFSKGDIIFEEEPVVSCQFAWNEDCGYKACHHCLRPLETAEENAQRLAMNDNIKLPHPENCIVDKSKHVPCPFCHVKYCSSECQMSAWNKYHKTLCTQKHECDNTHPLERLKEMWKEMHYPPETSTIMLFARIFALVHQAEDKRAVSDIIQQFCHSSTTDDDPSHNILGLKFSDHLDVLREGLLDCNIGEWVPQWTTPDGFRSLVALVGRNGQGIGTSSISDWVKNVKKLNLDENEKKFMDKFIDRLYDKFEDAVGAFLNNEGSGLYSTQSAINHSCRPNAEIAFPNSNHRLAVRCIEDISVEDEICISYLEECALERNRHGRQKILLKHYFFTCKCQRCDDEIDQPDETSEEEEEEEGDDEIDQSDETSEEEEEEGDDEIDQSDETNEEEEEEEGEKEVEWLNFGEARPRRW